MTPQRANQILTRLILPAAAIAALLMIGPATAAARRPSCQSRVRHAHLDARSRTAVIYDRRGSLYGCWKSTRRVTRMLRFASRCRYATRPGAPEYAATCHQQTSFAFPRLAGSRAGFVQGSDDEDAFVSTIHVFNLRLGTQRYAVNSSRTDMSVTYYYVRSFSLDSLGRSAWGLESFPDGVCGEHCVAPRPEDDTLEVYARDGGGMRVLDMGTGVNPRSVAISGASVSWINARTFRGAPLL